MSGITTSLHFTFAPEDLNALFEMAKEVGYDGVEPMIPRGSTDSPSPSSWPTRLDMEASLRHLCELKERFGLRTDTFYGGGLWVLPDLPPERVDREVALLSELLPMLAESCGTRSVTLNLAPALVAPGAGYSELDRNGSVAAEDRHFERAASVLQTLGDAVQTSGMKIALEMHGCSLADTGVSTRRLMEMTDHPAIGVTWDTGNLFTMGRAESWPKQLELVGPWITSVHLKNGLRFADGWRRVPLRDGAMVDVIDQILALKERGYEGALVVEAPGLRENHCNVAEKDLALIRESLGA